MLQEEITFKLELGEQASLSQKEGKVYEMLGVRENMGASGARYQGKERMGWSERRDRQSDYEGPCSLC